MQITNKIAYFKEKATFVPLIPTIPEGLNPIVFIENTREMWTCGTYFSIGYPVIEVSEVGGTVKVQIGNSYFLLSTTGESLSIRKGEDNRIILNSNALTKVDTSPPLIWEEATKKLLHMSSGVVQGSYGQSEIVDNVSSFIIPNLLVDKYGHITGATNINVQIRDYVEQLAVSVLPGERNILSTYSSNNTGTSTSQVRKTNGLTFNDSVKRLTVEGGIISNKDITVTKGDLVVENGYIVGNLKGEVSGEVTPKIHLSAKPEYGGSSTELYGHVKVQDELPKTIPPASSNNTNLTNKGVDAKAASPLMVWNAIVDVKKYVDTQGIKVTGTDDNLQKVDLSQGFIFSEDFSVKDKNIYINWIEL